jgi:hypothetical protein
MALEPVASEGAVERVIRVRIQSAHESPLPAALALFEGELSDTQLRSFRKGDLPSTLAARKVPTLAFRTPDQQTTYLAPMRALDSARSYTVVSRSSGLLGSFVVDEADALPLLTRVWPPRDAKGQATYMVFCGASGVSVEATTTLLEPGAVPAEVHPGTDAAGHFADRCLHMTTNHSAHEGVLMPPAKLFDVLLDPMPIELAATEPFDALACLADEIAFGPGCASVQDDRVLVRSAGVPLFWVLDAGAEGVAEATEPSGTLLVRGLTPGAQQTLSGSVYDRFGTNSPFSVTLETQLARGHLILNEVLADPLGAEPAQEWIELFNDGQRIESLENYVLEAGSDRLELPKIQIHPGEYALIAGKDFEPNTPSDVPMREGTTLVRLPKLGNGLTNSGEHLKLVTLEGDVVSEFPAAPKPKPGVSIARRKPWAASAATTSFGLHKSPGASPGAANEVD